jgi:hypothetical protein
MDLGTSPKFELREKMKVWSIMEADSGFLGRVFP